jgi:hypothetical protein
MKNVTNVRSSAISTFTEIAREQYQKWLSIKSALQEIEKNALSGTDDKDKEFEILHLEGEANKCFTLVIVFSAIAVEAYIYDYASRNLSDTYVKNYLDKLDPVSKWGIIPRLITGKELPRDHRWFEILNKLIKQRNSIVHEKSSSPPVKFDDAREYFKKAHQHTAMIYETAGEAIELLDLLITEMKSFDPSEIGWIDGYFSSKSDNSFKLLEEL